MSKVAIALLVAVLYAWVIMVTMPYRRNVIQDQDLSDYYETLERSKVAAQAQYDALAARPNVDAEQLLQAKERLALCLWEKREYETAEQLFREIVGTRKPKEGAPYDEKYVQCTLRLAGILRDQNNWPAAEGLYQEVLDYDKKFFEKTDPDNSKIARDLNNLGLVFYLKGTSEVDEKTRNTILKQGGEYLYQAIAKYRAKLGPDSPSEAISLWNLYLVERDQGNVGLADGLKAQAEAIDKKMNRPCKAP